MSKELIERLRSGHYYHAQVEQAADRIEELEGANTLNRNALRLQKEKIDALQVEVNKQQELLKYCITLGKLSLEIGDKDPTPKQASLHRLTLMNIEEEAKKYVSTMQTTEEVKSNV